MNTTEKMLLGNITEISEEYFKLSMELAEIAERKAYEWLQIKKTSHVTNAETDKLWDATADGRRETYLKIYLKGLQALRGARMLEYRANSGQL